MVTHIDSIIEACGEQTVCQFDGASVSNASDLSGVLPEGVRVVVIPQPDQAQSVQSSTLATQFKSATGAETVIIIEDHPGKDRFAVASDDDGTAITEALYSQGESDGGVAVASVAQTLAVDQPQPGGGGFDGGGVVLTGAAVVALIAVIGGAAIFARRRRKRATKQIVSSRRLTKELEGALNGPDGEFVRDAIDELDRRAAAYPDLATPLTSLARHVSELFVRVRKRGTDQQVRLLQAKYKDTLSKLLKALDDDYYGDIQQNPQFWSSPDERLNEVRRAVDSVDAQAVENIRQVNESRDLEFKVALDSLNRTVTEAKLSDVYSDRAEGTAGDHASRAVGDGDR
ncbi:MAG: hypothetical protein ACK5LO_02055 [Leucobacter sp.]